MRFPTLSKSKSPLFKSPLSYFKSFSSSIPKSPLPFSSPSFRYLSSVPSTSTEKMSKDKSFDRSAMESILTKRFFYVPSFSIYGGVAGLYDYGPIGSALQQNLINIWRQHFVIEEDMLEIDGAIITPAEVLKTSGHVDKFTDLMSKDTVTLEVFRADHLVEAVLEARLESDLAARTAEAQISKDSANALSQKKQKGSKPPVKLSDDIVNEYNEILAKIDNYNKIELSEIITKHDIRNPATNNTLTPPVEFNLMFESFIGPTGTHKGYLRPETAQAQFVNFSRLLEFNNQKMPFASAMVGKSFRNEISPRSGLLRVREFNMAEVEHFVDPENKAHKKFSEVANIKVRLLAAKTQEKGSTELTEMTIGDAVAQKIIDNQTLGYFIGRIYLYLIKIGIDPEKLRFRQHMSNEMAHYACDCWDAEIKSSYGWIECVGCADRSAFDLTVHSKKTKEKLVVRENLETPLIYDAFVCNINKKVFGPTFKQNAKPIQDHLESLSQSELESLKQQLDSQNSVTIQLKDNSSYEITSNMMTIDKQTFKESVREYTPNVIEPSFGIGRILYSLLEHSFCVRPDAELRAVFKFNPVVAPFKVLVLPLSGHDSFQPFLLSVARSLRSKGVPARVDDAASASIGRRYARNDELGIPFAITVDFQTVSENTITLRERDSTSQVRGPIEDILNTCVELVNGVSTWSSISQKFQSVSPSTEE
ncbi:hypothetical protein BB560_002054 [Smittium megazygosporum]|uniref:glycine--tRNA ligase n=1 Tax=Smittium megazygosporum TaxID=133381 RepID=A0A2T9ZFY1_9FUNG|nr:hypothetical protein BB560_002054 [Smittium megazygosporum]